MLAPGGRGFAERTERILNKIVVGHNLHRVAILMLTIGGKVDNDELHTERV